MYVWVDRLLFIRNPDFFHVLNWPSPWRGLFWLTGIMTQKRPAFLPSAWILNSKHINLYLVGKIPQVSQVYWRLNFMPLVLNKISWHLLIIWSVLPLNPPQQPPSITLHLTLICRMLELHLCVVWNRALTSNKCPNVWNSFSQLYATHAESTAINA